MSKVSVLRCNEYDPELIYNVIKQSLVNIDFHLPTNKTVLLKPNVLGQRKPETAVDTHPAVIDAVCRLLKEKDNEIWIGDSGGISAYGGTKKAFQVSGIEAAAKKHNAKLISFEGSRRKKIIDNNAKILKEFILAGEPFLADMVINIPKLKTHVLTKYTGAVKNIYGCVPGGGKAKKHALAPNEDSFSQLLLDIYQNIPIHLNIMDAIVGLEGDGPGSAGIPKKAGLILVSENAPSLDIEASRIIGYNPLDIKSISYAIERNLSPKIEDVEIIGEKNINVNFKKPTAKTQLASKLPKPMLKFLFNLASYKPYTNKDRCKKCNVCADVCPVDAIELDPYPEFNRQKCILCYCCHENCPHNAIDLGHNLITRVYKKVKEIFGEG